jgi:hypothetical protein
MNMTTLADCESADTIVANFHCALGRPSPDGSGLPRQIGALAMFESADC